MFHVVLYEPEIPPNTGNIIRLCANTGNKLHLIEPLGFTLSDKELRRAGLDYIDGTTVATYRHLDEFIQRVQPPRIYAFTTRGRQVYSEISYQTNDAFMFGPETRGLPTSVLDAVPESSRLRLPMQAKSRSLNLSNAVAIVVYEAWRQQGFVGGG